MVFLQSPSFLCPAFLSLGLTLPVCDPWFIPWLEKFCVLMQQASRRPPVMSVGLLKMWEWKMSEWKMWEQTARMKNALSFAKDAVFFARCLLISSLFECWPFCQPVSTQQFYLYCLSNLIIIPLQCFFMSISVLLIFQICSVLFSILHPSLAATAHLHWDGCHPFLLLYFLKININRHW